MLQFYKCVKIALVNVYACNFFSPEIDSGFYTVKFDSLLMKDAVMEADGVIPPLREDDPLSSDSELDDEDDAAYAKGVYKRVCWHS